MDFLDDTGGGRAGDVLLLAEQIAAGVAEGGVSARLLGGVAVALRCPVARAPGALAREFSDLDFAARRGARDAFAAVLAAQGFEPATRFNAANGHTRLLFENADGLHVDVFVDKFAMCHALNLKPRIDVNERTLPLADLVLTKLQVAEVNRKDVADVVAVLHDHQLTSDDSGINVDYLGGILAKDWGWWRTVTANLDVVVTTLPQLGLDAASAQTARGRLDELVAAIGDRPKSARWKARAVVGDRVSWRELPEEPGAGPVAPIAAR